MASSTKTMWRRIQDVKKVAEKTSTSEPPKKKIIWPKLIVCTDKNICAINNKEVKVLWEDHQDGEYLGISWSNSDVYVSCKPWAMKFKKQKGWIKPRRAPMKEGTEGTGAILFDHPKPLVFIDTSAGVREYTTILAVNRKVSTRTTIEKQKAQNEEYEIRHVENKLLLFDKVANIKIDELELDAKINDVKVLSEKFSHNGLEFPIDV